MTNVHVVCFFASYVLALALEGLRLVRRNALVRTLLLAFGFAGLLAQSLYLIQRSNQADLPPLLSSSHDWLLVLAWTVVVFYLALALVLSLHGRDLPIGLFLLPVVLILIGASRLVGDAPNPALANASDAAIDAGVRQAALRGWSMLHASVLVFGIGAVIVGFLVSAWYLIQHRRLKHRQAAHSGLELPSLATLATLIWWTVVISIPLLTLGLLTGVPLVFLSRNTPGPIAFSDRLIMGSVAIWIVMIALFGWILRSARAGGRQIAWRTMWCFGFLIFTLIGLQVLTRGHASLKSSAIEASAPQAIACAVRESFHP